MLNLQQPPGMQNSFDRSILRWLIPPEVRQSIVGMDLSTIREDRSDR